MFWANNAKFIKIYENENDFVTLRNGFIVISERENSKIRIIEALFQSLKSFYSWYIP